MSEEILNLENLNANKLPELLGFEQKQNELVEQCPYVEITDNASYEVAKKHRTALLKGRTTLEAQDKLIASKLTNFRKEVKTITDNLISITLPHENKQQEEVKRYEQIKENERIEKERLENLRIETIKNKISELESNSYILINSWTAEVLKNSDCSVFAGMETDFDFEEYDLLYEQAKQRVQEHCEMKINSLREKENQRIENERLQKEKLESDAKLKAIEEQLEKERFERESKDREEKEKVFEIRQTRLGEIGLIYSDEHDTYFIDKDCEFILLSYDIFNTDALGFEEIISEAKNAIVEFKVKQSIENKEKASREKAEIEAKKKAEQENKARVKRLAKDKGIYEKILNENLSCFPIVFDSDQQELKEFSIEASKRVYDLLKELLTELENL